jgi:hypothetical protein
MSWATANIAAFNMEGHRFDRLALERAELPRYVMEKVLSGLTADKT